MVVVIVVVISLLRRYRRRIVFLTQWWSHEVWWGKDPDCRERVVGGKEDDVLNGSLGPGSSMWDLENRRGRDSETSYTRENVRTGGVYSQFGNWME